MSRINFGAKPWVYPMPVLIVATYDEAGVPNAMNAAWGMISDANEITISMSEHKTTKNLLVTGEFTVSFATEDMVIPCDYVGIISGNDVPDKFERAGFHATKSEYVNAPLIDELPMALECRVKSYEDEILIGEIVNVNADESILTNGMIDMRKLKPIAYDPVGHTYVGMGATVGRAFSDGKQLAEIEAGGGRKEIAEEGIETVEAAEPAIEIEPLSEENVDFDTFCQSDFRAVKVKECSAVKKSKKLLHFVLDDGTGTDRIILSGIHAYYEPEKLVGKTLLAITNLPPRKMMGIESCGMLMSAVHNVGDEEKLNLIMLDDAIPAGAKLY